MKTKDHNLIRAKILSALKKQDLTINALGIAMQEIGLMSREMVHKYLSGRNDISTARASAIMRYLRIV